MKTTINATVSVSFLVDIEVEVDSTEDDCAVRDKMRLVAAKKVVKESITPSAILVYKVNRVASTTTN